MARYPGRATAATAGRSASRRRGPQRPGHNDTVLRLSRSSELAGSLPLHAQTLAALTRRLDDGRLAIHNDAAECALRDVAIGRKNWLFAGSDRGRIRVAAIDSLIEAGKLNGLDPLT